MQTVTIVAAAPHSFGFPTLAAVAATLIVVGFLAWHVIARSRAFRQDEHLGHSGG